MRERDKEFSEKNIPRHLLINDVKDTIAIIKNTLSKLNTDSLEQDFPITLNNMVSSTASVLVYLLVHLNYHLGQVNYHRRLVA